MVQNDPNGVVGLFLESPSFVDFRDRSIFVLQTNFAHRDGKIATDVNGNIFDGAGAPAFQSKAAVIRKITIAANKIGQSALAGDPESLR